MHKDKTSTHKTENNLRDPHGSPVFIAGRKWMLE